jgi:hypothetical protein
MSRYPEAQTCSSTHHLTPLTLDGGSEVRPMWVSYVVLAGTASLLSTKPGWRGTHTISPEMHGCSPINQQAGCRRKFTELDECFKSFPHVVSCERGERCAESTVHPVVHRSVHLEGDPKPYGTKRLCNARQRIRTRLNTGMGWSDPTFGQMLVAKRPPGSLRPSTLVA